MKIIKTAADCLCTFFGAVFMCISTAFSFITISFGFIANAFCNKMNIKQTWQKYTCDVIDKIDRLHAMEKES